MKTFNPSGSPDATYKEESGNPPSAEIAAI
jgi:hypothetical protein